jgi:hypothetical protein
MVGVKTTVLTEGLLGGAILSVAAIVLGVLGLSPSFTWIPEALLLAAFVLVYVGIAGAIGGRAGMHSGRVMAGTLAGVIAGAIAGCAGGLTYVAFGKPVLNVLIGAIGGALAGGIAGGVGAVLDLRREPAQRR